MAKGKNSMNVGQKLAREIYNQTQKGTSKREDRLRNGKDVTRPDGTVYRQMGKATYLHSETTAENYVNSCKEFGRWVENKYKVRGDLDAAKSHVAEWLNLSPNANTQKAHAAALARGFKCSVDDFKADGYKPNVRYATGVTRGRPDGGYSKAASNRTAAWRANHAEEAEALRSCGLRVSEARDLRSGDIRVDEMSGRVTIVVQSGKGGRPREVRVWETVDNHAGADWLRKHAEKDSKAFVFRNVPGIAKANVHSLRAEYAARMYDLYRTEGAAASGQTYTPHDGSGKEFDKGILSAVSADLGHGADRCHTIYYNYLAYGWETDG